MNQDRRFYIQFSQSIANAKPLNGFIISTSVPLNFDVGSQSIKAMSLDISY